MRAILFSLGAVSVTAERDGEENGSRSLLIENRAAAPSPRLRGSSDSARRTKNIIPDRKSSRISDRMFSQMHNGDLNLGDRSPWNPRTGTMKLLVTETRSHSEDSEGGDEKKTPKTNKDEPNLEGKKLETYEDENKLLESMAKENDKSVIEDLLERLSQKKGFTYEGNKSRSGKWNGEGKIRLLENNVVLQGQSKDGKFAIKRIENAKKAGYEPWQLAHWNEIALKHAS